MYILMIQNALLWQEGRPLSEILGNKAKMREQLEVSPSASQPVAIQASKLLMETIIVNLNKFTP